MPEAASQDDHILGTKAFAAGSALMVLAFIAINIARIASVSADHGETPFLSANDRSRWCAIAALLEDHTYAIDRFLELRDSKGKVRTWYSIDMVRHADQDGVEHYYSSKPPLLTLAYAAGTWPAMVATQRRVSQYPMLVGRLALILINIPAMVVFALWWRRAIASNIDSAWVAWLLLIGGLFGTFLTTFAVTLNNHLHAAVCLVITLILIYRLFQARAMDSNRSAFWILVGLGCFAGCTVMCDLPALAWAGIIPLIIFDKRRWLLDWSHYGIGLVPVLAAIVGVNWYAHGDWRPPYSHREALGEQLLTVKPEQIPIPETSTDLHSLDAGSVSQLAAKFDLAEVKDRLKIASPIVIEPARRLNTLRLRAADATDPAVEHRFAVVLEGGQWSIHRWNDWYDYPRSYWLPENKRGVDIGEPSPAVYAWNCLLGHHGMFSLTPLFLLCFPGAWVASRSKDLYVRRLAWGIILTSGVCIAFYLSRDQLDRNYGGVASGFRWQFFLIPAWLWLCMQAFAAGHGGWLQNTFARRVLELALVVSLFSAWCPAANPWQHPWMYQWYLSLMAN